MMNQKHIGVILIILGLLAASFVFIVKAREDRNIALIVQQQNGSCFLEDGTCLHEQNLYPYLIGWIVAASLIILGIYLAIFDKTQKTLMRQHSQIASTLKEARQQEKQKDEFRAFLAGFSEEEQKILNVIHEQEGIKQATLRYKTGMSKATLSLLIKSLEERGIITKKPSGKTNELYLMKRF